MNVGVVFGDPNTRAGGKALDHYATHIFMLKEVRKITSDNKINQGIEVKVKIKRNKTGGRYNDVMMNILHGYGIDNFGSAINFLWGLLINLNDLVITLYFMMKKCIGLI